MQNNSPKNSLIQVHRALSLHTVIAIGASIGVSVGVLAVLGRLILLHGAKMNVMSYGWLTLFFIPFMLTYAERATAINESGGLYEMVRSRHALTLTFWVGWFVLGGYATVIAILARVIITYGLTLSTVMGGRQGLDIQLLAIGLVIFFGLFKMMGWRSSHPLTTALSYGGLLLLAGMAIYSMLQTPPSVTVLSSILIDTRPLHLSALLTSSFWGALLVLALRNEVVQRQKDSVLRIFGALGGVIIVLGMLLALGTLPTMTNATDMMQTLSVNNLSAIVFTGSPTGTMAIALVAIVLAFIGLSRSFDASVAVFFAMSTDAYLPAVLRKRVGGAPVVALLAVVLFTAILLITFDLLVLVGLSAALLLGVTLAVHAPDIVQSSPVLPKDRSLQLPYHPLFPGITVVAAVVALVNLDWLVLKWGLLWVALGILLLLGYSYRRALRVRGQQQTYTETEADAALKRVFGESASADADTLLTFVLDLKYLPETLTVGSRLAKHLDSALTLVYIVEVADEYALWTHDEQAQAYWLQLATEIEQWRKKHDVSVFIKPVVRVTTDAIDGVIHAAQETHAQFLLLPPDFVAEELIRNTEQYDKILRLAPGNILFLSQFPDHIPLAHATVLVGDGSQAGVALVVADALVAEDGVIEVIHYLPSDAMPAEESAARARVQAMVHQSDIEDERALVRILPMTTLEDAVEELASDTDLLILGAQHNFMTRRAMFGGINAQIFHRLAVPTLIVRAHKKIRFAWLARLWETLTAPLPNLTLEEKEAVVYEVISGATPTVDFFILIILSSGIAMYGLLQNSGAVIIGAMLVAPLMSPIVSMAMSIVRGDIKHLGLGAQATAQGVLLAIFMGALLTFFSPLRQPTNEIMARVHPNLLDLGVAFLSGAAGGYAMSRKSIAAALPGVAIAAALVPPLAVVGYGFATADLTIAFGALLLFITNLIAIVLAGALVFLALDFLAPEKKNWREVVRGLRVTLVFLVIIILILGVFTYNAVIEQKQLAAIHRVLNQSLYQSSFEPVNVQINKIHGGYQIKATVLSYDRPLSSEELTSLGHELEAAVGAPVAMDVIFVPSQRNVFTFEAAVTTAQIEEAIRSALASLPLAIVDLQVDPVRDGYQVTLTVAEFEPGALSSAGLAQLRADLTQQFDAPFEITLYKLPTEKLVVTPTP